MNAKPLPHHKRRSVEASGAAGSSALGDFSLPMSVTLRCAAEGYTSARLRSAGDCSTATFCGK